jgi:hypothetical protein
MAIPETISVGGADRVTAHERAQLIATALLALGVPVLSWTVELSGEIDMTIRQGGEALRIYQVAGALPVDPAPILARFNLLEAHV